MFKSKQDSEQRKIRLPKRAGSPGPEYLQFMLDQAYQYRGQEVEVSWTESTGTLQYSLVVKAERENTGIAWKLWEYTGQQNQLVWTQEGADPELISNMISMMDGGAPQQSTPTKAAASPTSPYRQLFSASYHGIAAAPSIRDSLVRMRPVEVPQAASSNNLEPIPAQTISTGALTPVTLSDNAPSFAIKDSITSGLKQLSGNRQIMPVYIMSDTTVTGTLEQTGMHNAQLIELISTKKFTGKLEFNAQDLRAEIFFVNGELHSAFAASSQGNEAMTELLIAQPSSFRFTIDDQSPIRNISLPLTNLVSDAIAIRDQLAHLEKAGLKPQALIIKTQESVGDSELKLLLMKNSTIDISSQIAIYKEMERKFTLMHLLGKRPMSKSIWVPILFNFYTCGLVEIKPPLSLNDEQLEFLGDAKSAVLALKNTFIRKETGVLTYPALLYFLQYEFLRYQSYDWPLSLIVFEMSKQSPMAAGGTDLIDQSETLAALQRIAAIKRPLDHIGHFETIDYALLLPNTIVSTANQIAHQIIQVLRAEPLSAELDEKLLKLSFGIANIPSHCGDIESIIMLAKKALTQAKSGHFPVILAQAEK